MVLRKCLKCKCIWLRILIHFLQGLFYNLKQLFRIQVEYIRHACCLSLPISLGLWVTKCCINLLYSLENGWTLRISFNQTEGQSIDFLGAKGHVFNSIHQVGLNLLRLFLLRKLNIHLTNILNTRHRLSPGLWYQFKTRINLLLYLLS